MRAPIPRPCRGEPRGGQSTPTLGASGLRAHREAFSQLRAGPSLCAELGSAAGGVGASAAEGLGASPAHGGASGGARHAEGASLRPQSIFHPGGQNEYLNPRALLPYPPRGGATSGSGAETRKGAGKSPENEAATRWLILPAAPCSAPPNTIAGVTLPPATGCHRAAPAAQCRARGATRRP